MKSLSKFYSFDFCSSHKVCSVVRDLPTFLWAYICHDSVEFTSLHVAKGSVLDFFSYFILLKKRQDYKREEVLHIEC